MPTPHVWLRNLAQAAPTRALAHALRAASPGNAPSEHIRVAVQNSRGSSATLTAGMLAHHTQRPVLLVVAHLDEADDAMDDLALFPDAGMPIASAPWKCYRVNPMSAWNSWPSGCS